MPLPAVQHPVYKVQALCFPCASHTAGMSGSFQTRKPRHGAERGHRGLVTQPRRPRPPDGLINLVGLSCVAHPSTPSSFQGFHHFPKGAQPLGNPVLGSRTPSKDPREAENTAPAQPLWSKKEALG